METPVFNDTDPLGSFRKTYKLRLSQGKQGDKKTVEVTIPAVVVERESRIRGLTIEEFVQQFQAVASFYDSEGRISYSFKKISLNNKDHK